MRYQEDQFRNAIVKGESYQQAIFRIIEQSAGEEVVIITHGGAMRSLRTCCNCAKGLKGELLRVAE